MLHQPLAPLETVAPEEPTPHSDPRSTIPDGNTWELVTFALVAPGSMVVALATTFLVSWAAEGHQLAALWAGIGLYTLFLGALAGVRLGAASRV
jgi:hypothetical protein